MPEKGKKADLMFLQHMLAVTKHDGHAWPPSCPTACCSAAARSAIRANIHRGRPARGRHRPAPTSSTAPASPPASWCCEGKGAKPGAPGQGAVHQRRPRVLRGPRPEPPAPEHIEKIVRAYRHGQVPASRHGAPRRSRRERLQLQHPPLRRQRPAARAPGRARPPARRRAEGDRKQHGQVKSRITQARSCQQSRSKAGDRAERRSHRQGALATVRDLVARTRQKHHGARQHAGKLAAA
jgi:hypothetical protein